MLYYFPFTFKPPENCHFAKLIRLAAYVKTSDSVSFNKTTEVFLSKPIAKIFERKNWIQNLRWSTWAGARILFIWFDMQAS